ncbi:hypothetical protein QUF50_09190 [Thiotrichales bacterium HSG1]|nr:hypothetical protein [Thiotrichales bacterium HSG1]
MSLKKVKDNKRKRGYPKKGKEIGKEPTCLKQQMNVTEMLNDLPKNCDIGCKITIN